jgi:uncharacterized protein YqcC (DUF446 family)
MNKHQALSKLLLSLEENLIKANLWQELPVRSDLLQSTEPFCHDTLKAEQWLQFVFLTKLEQSVKLNLPLPTNCDITPYIAEALKDHEQVGLITKATKDIDSLLSN